MWGHNDIKGKTAEEKLTHCGILFHMILLEALFYLSDSGDSYIILNQLKNMVRVIF